MSAYVKETGDFFDPQGAGSFDNDESRAAPLFEHLTRSFDHRSTTGARTGCR